MTTELTAYIIQGLWLFWALCWLAASVRNKKARDREATWSRLRYQIVIAAGVLQLFLGLPTLDNADSELFTRYPGFHIVCVQLVAAGLGWALYARFHLGANWSGTVQVKRDHQLIRSGPYRYTRHPIYSGLLLAFLGLDLFLDRWLGIPAILLLVAGFRMKIAREEKFMRRQFGRMYEAYTAEVPMLLPRLF